MKDAASDVAAENKVSRATVHRAARYAEAVDAIAANAGHEAREAILNRESSFTAKDVHRVAKWNRVNRKWLCPKSCQGKPRVL